MTAVAVTAMSHFLFLYSHVWQTYEFDLLEHSKLKTLSTVYMHQTKLLLEIIKYNLLPIEVIFSYLWNSYVTPWLCLKEQFTINGI